MEVSGPVVSLFQGQALVSIAYLNRYFRIFVCVALQRTQRVTILARWTQKSTPMVRSVVGILVPIVNYYAPVILQQILQI